MTWLRRVALMLLLGTAGWLLAASSAVPAPWYAANAAMLRLSWVARPERIEECRALGEAELATRPAHMRQARECRGRSATYRLHVVVDGVPTVDRVLEGGGFRKDRAIFVLDEYDVPPGRRRFVVQFSRVEPSDAPMDSTSLRRGAVPRELLLDTIVTMPKSAVALVSFVDGRLHLHLP